MNTRAKGLAGERRAEAFLVQRGYQVLARNFRTRRGEVDLIVANPARLAFVEVKTWDALGQDSLGQAIGARKAAAHHRGGPQLLEPASAARTPRFRRDPAARGRGPAPRGRLRRSGLMVRIAKKTDPRRLEELKKKIHDERYLAMAISKIAQDLTLNIHREE